MAEIVASANSNDLTQLVALNPVEIDLLPWEPVIDAPGVSQKTLWRYGDIVQCLLHLQPGSGTPGEPHLAAHHHMWVVSGAATIAGRRLPTGSYLHVPPGIRHPIGDVGPEGCTILYTYRPHGPHTAMAQPFDV